MKEAPAEAEGIRDTPAATISRVALPRPHSALAGLDSLLLSYDSDTMLSNEGDSPVGAIAFVQSDCSDSDGDSVERRERKDKSRIAVSSLGNVSALAVAGMAAHETNEVHLKDGGPPRSQAVESKDTNFPVNAIMSLFAGRSRSATGDNSGSNDGNTAGSGSASGVSRGNLDGVRNNVEDGSGYADANADDINNGNGDMSNRDDNDAIPFAPQTVSVPDLPPRAAVNYEPMEEDEEVEAEQDGAGASKGDNSKNKSQYYPALIVSEKVRAWKMGLTGSADDGEGEEGDGESDSSFHTALASAAGRDGAGVGVGGGGVRGWGDGTGPVAIRARQAGSESGSEVNESEGQEFGGIRDGGSDSEESTGNTVTARVSVPLNPARAGGQAEGDDDVAAYVDDWRGSEDSEDGGEGYKPVEVKEGSDSEESTGRTGRVGVSVGELKDERESDDSSEEWYSDGEREGGAAVYLREYPNLTVREQGGDDRVSSTGDYPALRVRGGVRGGTGGGGGRGVTARIEDEHRGDVDSQEEEDVESSEGSNHAREEDERGAPGLRAAGEEVADQSGKANKGNRADQWAEMQQEGERAWVAPRVAAAAMVREEANTEAHLHAQTDEQSAALDESREAPGEEGSAQAARAISVGEDSSAMHVPVSTEPKPHHQLS